MKTLDTLKKVLVAFALVATLGLAGCVANGNGGSDDDRDVDPSKDCAVPLGTLCLLGGTDTQHGLVDDLIGENGALAPLTNHIAPTRDTLVELLTALLENDSTLANLVENLLLGDNVELAAAVLLDGGLNKIITDLVDPATLQGLLGPDGLTGVVQGLVQGGSVDAQCQVALSTICVLGGQNGQVGLLDALFTDNGALADIAPGLSQDELLATLATLLQGDGSILGAVTGTLEEGKLIEGLNALLDPEASGSLASALGSLLTDQGEEPGLITGLLSFLGSLFAV